MYEHITQMEPLYPAHAEKLEDLGREVVAVSGKLEGRLAPPTLVGIRSLLRVVNSYYSNLIEGHSTHPIDIERAMRSDYSADQDKRDLQVESQIHIEVQEELAKRLGEEPDLNVASPELLRWIHERFYSRMPERLRWVKGDDQEKEWVEAGVFRNRSVARAVTLRAEVFPVLREVAIEGEIPRGEVFRLIGMSERSGRDILGSLLAEGLLVSDSPRGSVRLGFPTHAAGYWFPELYPPEKMEGSA